MCRTSVSSCLLKCWQPSHTLQYSIVVPIESSQCFHRAYDIEEITYSAILKILIDLNATKPSDKN